MTSDQPVQKKYLSLPRPFYPEVKAILRTCLTEVFFRKSTSPFSISVVCVRKRDGGMRLCIDYRELNKKTVPDRHPIPRIQEALDSLGGKSWFSVLDQGRDSWESTVNHWQPLSHRGGCKNGFGYPSDWWMRQQIFRDLWRIASESSATRYVFLTWMM